jgi:hypothetical protein
MQPIYYLYYKIFICIYTLVWLILTITYDNSYLNDFTKINNTVSNSTKHSWYYYFSNQVYLIQFVYYFLITTILVIIYFHHLKLLGFKDLLLKRKEVSRITLRTILATWSNSDQQYPHILTIIIWAGNTIILPLSYFVTIMFFFNLIRDFQYVKQLIYPSDNIGMLRLWLNLNVNIINSVIITFDFILSLIPVRIYHFYLPLVFSILYSILIQIMVSVYNLKQLYILFIGDIPVSVQLSIIIGLMVVIHFLHAFAFRFKLWLTYDILKHADITDAAVELKIERKSESSS